MSKIDYVIREDGNPCMFPAESESELFETDFWIDEYYPYISRAMLEEEYFIRHLSCHIFDEIVYENKVVGFATFEVRNNFEVILTECYILPEFRGKRLFFDEICKFHFSSPRFGILNPTRNVIELLLRYAFAKYATDDIVVSAIDLYLDPFDIQSNKRDGFPNLLVPSSNFYDSSICSTLFIHDDEIFYHPLLQYDYSQGHRRKKLKKGYFSNIKKLFSRNHDKFEKMIADLKKELPDNKLGYDVIVGYGSDLSQYMWGMVEREMISYEKALTIRQQLIKEYEEGIIDDDTIEDRFNDLSLSEYTLIKNFSDLKKLVEDDELDDELGYFKELVNIAGDDDELGNNLFNALLDGNEVEFNDILMDHFKMEEEPSLEYLDSLSDDFDPETDAKSLKEDVKKSLEEKYRLENVMSGKDCSVSYESELYYILYPLIFGDNYYDASTPVEDVSLVPIELLTGLLVDSNYIKKEGILEIDWNDEELLKTPNGYFKRILASNNLDYEGDKPELLKRLADNNVTLGDDYKITQEGKDFLKKYVWIGVYWEFFEEFDFNDFYRYLDNHKGDLKEVSLKYLNEHFKLARKMGDEFYLEECLYVKEIIEDEFDDFINELNTLE